MKLYCSIALLLCLCALWASAQPAAVPTAEEVQKITAAAPAKPTATPLRPRRLLVFSRSDAVKHTAIPYGAKAVEIMGQKTGAYAAVNSDDLAIFAPERLKDFDAVFFNNGYGFKLDESARRALMEFVESGKGLAGIHAASANFVGWPEGTRLFHAKFKSHPWTPKDEWAVMNEDPTHPLNAAFDGKGFRVKDEIYVFSDFHRHRVRVLLSLDLADERTAKVPHTDTYVPISWLHTVGKGRVFFCSLGHVHDLFWTPAILQHYLDGIQFALGDLKADAEPTPAAREWAFTALLADRTADIRPPLDAL
ncbi:MAG: ThuA domain-containing protein, partial [Planctomycetes bacterium]|nr:ThuA domain-containing protein [Planctomycetota bacterium]